jgi:hypothetical protein
MEEDLAFSRAAVAQLTQSHFPLLNEIILSVSFGLRELWPGGTKSLVRSMRSRIHPRCAQRPHAPNIFGTLLSNNEMV